MGIDFGTANASAVFARDVIRQQPAQIGDFSFSRMNEVPFETGQETGPEVPTEMAYADGRWRDVQWLWGGEVAENVKIGELKEDNRIRWLKLGIGEEPETRAFRETHKRQLADLPRIVDEKGTSRPYEMSDVISEFLYRIWESTKDAAKMRWRGWAESALEAEEYECCIAVPALWTAEKIEVMIKAAHVAGMRNVYIESEPACAAHMLLLQNFEQDRDATMHESSGQVQNELLDKPFMVVDLGAGTGVCGSSAAKRVMMS